MKKIATFFSVVAIAAITFVSCSKKGDYTCTCTINVSGQTQTVSGTYTNVKKSDAEKSCDDLESTTNAQWASMGASVSCSLN